MPRAFTVNEQPPSRRKVWWGLGCLASVMLVSCAGVIGWLVAVLIGLSPFGGSESSLANQWPAAQERQQTLRDVFDGQRQPLNDPDLGQIRRLLDQIAAAGRDHGAATVDCPFENARLRRSGAFFCRNIPECGMNRQDCAMSIVPVMASLANGLGNPSHRISYFST